MLRFRALGGVLALLLALGVLPFGAPPATAQTQSRVYVGEVSAAGVPDALIAIVVGANGEAAVYACSKDDAWNQQASKWFTGQLSSGGQLTAKAADGSEVSGTLQGSRLSGQLGALSFAADQVTSGTAGLYRGRADDEIHAVIEAPDGRRVGRVWSVTTGAHSGTWDFSTATATPVSGGLQVQRNQPQFIFVELRACTNAFCE
jgi:hypothetical protein